MRPLRRKPKQLAEEPSLYEPGGSGVGLVLSGGTRRRCRRDRAAGGRTEPGVTAAGVSDEPAELVPLDDVADRPAGDEVAPGAGAGDRAPARATAPGHG